MRYLVALLGLLTLNVTSLVAPSPASAAAPLTLWVIVGFGSQKCIDDPNFATANNVVFDIWTCVSPRQRNEQWIWRQKEPAVYEIVNAHSGKCMTVQNGSMNNNAAILQFDCNGGANQEWGQLPSFSYNGYDYYSIMNWKSGRCITVKNVGVTNGSKLLQFDCNDASNSTWTWRA
jgi:hypothetical protein